MTCSIFSRKTPPKTGAFVKFLREFGSADSLFIVLERKSGGEVESFGPFAEVLADRLMDTGEFNEIIRRLGPEVKEKMARQFLHKALLYLSEEDLKTLEARLSDGGIEQQVKLLKTRLSSMFISPLTAYDPLDLLPLFQKNLPFPSWGGGMDSSGYFLSADRKMLLLIGKPRGSAPDVGYDRMLMEKIKAAERSAREAFSLQRDLPSDLEQVSKGVLLAGLTTLWGFGSLVFSTYPGLRSMGSVALMGVGFSLLIALTLVPAVMQKWLQKKQPS